MREFENEGCPERSRIERMRMRMREFESARRMEYISLT